MSDDLVILQREVMPEGAAVRVFGVPFRGRWSKLSARTLQRRWPDLFSLTKASRHWLAALAISKQRRA